MVVVENNALIVKSINGVDESFVFEYVTTNMTGKRLDMERVCFQLDNSMKVEILQLVATQAQAMFWKPHNGASIVRGFFLMNNYLHVNIVNPQMLRPFFFFFFFFFCILEKASNNVLSEKSILKKELIKYTKTNGITRMRMHVDCAYSRLLVERK
jgi:hypothetical protein